jgi:[protein-PII] uridylyltransferase
MLKMLYLLTVADSMATGPKAWNDWTSSLLSNLFSRSSMCSSTANWPPAEP